MPLYPFTVDELTLFNQIWRGEIVLERAKVWRFEFACHYGNYPRPGILVGTRHQEMVAKSAADVSATR